MCADGIHKAISKIGRIGERGDAKRQRISSSRGRVQKQFHLQCAHAALPLVAALPPYKGFPASFGGADAFVDR
jgi:hypothetical protein